MLFTNSQILEAARTLRPLLPQELDTTTAQQLDQQLAQLLNQTDLDENTQVDRLYEILESHPKIKSWLDDFLKNLTSTQKTYNRLSPDPGLQAATKYVCPSGNDYTWFREENEPIPLCKTHLVSLVPAQS
jgi:hypothetical protein